MKKRFILAIILAFLFFGTLAAVAVNSGNRGKNFIETPKIPSVRGSIVNVGANSVEIKVSGAQSTKVLKVSPQTLIYKKTRAGQVSANDLKAGIKDLAKGDTIIATSDNISGREINTKKIWEIKAFLVYTGQINTEDNWAGQLVSFNKSNGVMVVRKKDDQKEVKVQVTEQTKVSANNEKVHPNQIKPGQKIRMIVRWPGYEEDRPEVVLATEIKDAKTYVIDTFREKFGPILADGNILGVDTEAKMLKVGETNGSAITVAFNRATRWIPGDANIRKPADFKGHGVYVFGKDTKRGVQTAAQIISESAISSLFDDIVNSGGIVGGEIRLLAMGDLVNLDSTRISVRMGNGEKIISKIRPDTVFVKKGKRINSSGINAGDWVMVRGIAGFKNQPSIALIVVSFGKVDQNLKQ